VPTKLPSPRDVSSGTTAISVIHFEYEEVLGKPWRRGIVGFAKRRAMLSSSRPVLALGRLHGHGERRLIWASSATISDVWSASGNSWWTLRVPFLSSFEESSAESAIGTIWSSSPWSIPIFSLSQRADREGNENGRARR